MLEDGGEKGRWTEALGFRNLPPMKISALVASVAWVVALVACNGGAGPDSTQVGAPCTHDSDCVKSCLKTGDFGAGMCTVPCASDGDCPAGGTCIKSGGGVCAPACGAASDCTDFGATWTCGNEDGIAGSSVMVCRLP